MRRFILALAALAAAAPAVAHHGWSSYDESNRLTLTGPFTSVDWANPHGTATMQWEGKTWDVVLAPISRMEARGLSEEMIEPGRRVTITAYPRRDGTAEVRVEQIKVGDETIELR